MAPFHSTHPESLPHATGADPGDRTGLPLANPLANPLAMEKHFSELRYRMVHQQLRVRGIDDIHVLRAMATVPRHKFVPLPEIDLAYSDRAVPIGYGQTLSQPYIVAYMLSEAALQPQSRVLEIGTGSGYQTALLASIVKTVYSVEILPQLAKRAAKTLMELGYHNVHLKVGNGHTGWAEHAPYDAILVAAACPSLPPALVDQLAPQGRLVLPIGETDQNLFTLHNTSEGLTMNCTMPVRFVPMTGHPLGPNL